MSRVSLHNPHHSNLLLREANRMRLSQTLCDVVISVGSEEFHAHSLVLACVSRTFETLFRTRSVRYTLDFLASRTFELILEYSYTDSLEAPAEELGELLQAAGILAMEGLEKQILAATARPELTGRTGDEDWTLARKSEGARAVMDRELTSASPRRSAPSERFEAALVEGETPSAMELATQDTGPEDALLAKTEFLEDKAAMACDPPKKDGSPESAGALSRAESLPTRGTVITAPGRSAPGQQRADPLAPDGLRWPRYEMPVRPFVAVPPLDPSHFRAVPAVLPHISQAPMAFSATVDFSSYPRQALQGATRLELRGRPGQEGSRTIPAFRARGIGGNLLHMSESTTAPQRMTETVNSFLCKLCGKRFSDSRHLELHLLAHAGEKPFECKLCHQRSRDYSAMIKHLRTHNGALPYQCTVCREFCSSLSAMQKHIKSHKPEEIPSDWSLEETYLYLCYV
ncbi:zinc finger and BTB domain-containing protein 16 [Scyliorhinus canicula]|uniref:zinc finger and BTB domain-containing protein 16 n=1 Tax=Scyliorhinus canicula TaxID=7830 RepID=UPI0018F31359|nr:zinc finger and BTB domain-containing protein 16 [Scyliorhinus canicula]